MTTTDAKIPLKMSDLLPALSERWSELLGAPVVASGPWIYATTGQRVLAAEVAGVDALFAAPLLNDSNDVTATVAELERQLLSLMTVN